MEIALPEVKLAEYAATIQASCQVHDFGERVSVLQCLKVEPVIVAAWLPWLPYS
jgi:hypothetical protein